MEKINEKLWNYDSFKTRFHRSVKIVKIVKQDTLDNIPVFNDMLSTETLTPD